MPLRRITAIAASRELARRGQAATNRRRREVTRRRRGGETASRSSRRVGGCARRPWHRGAPGRRGGRYARRRRGRNENSRHRVEVGRAGSAREVAHDTSSCRTLDCQIISTFRVQRVSEHPNFPSATRAARCPPMSLFFPRASVVAPRRSALARSLARTLLHARAGRETRSRSSPMPPSRRGRGHHDHAHLLRG